MADKPNGDYYYDAGAINEQLKDYEVYEQDGRLYFNRKATDDEAVALDGLAFLCTEPRAVHMTKGDLDEGEGALYVFEDEDSDTYSLEFAFYSPNGSVIISTLDADLERA